MIAPNPFTPKSGWEPKVFIGRDKEIELFRKKLEEAKLGKCDHFLILGEWGIGKTTLLKEFKKIAQEKGHLTSLVTIGEYAENNTFNDGIKQLIEEIPLKFPIGFVKFKEFTKQLNGLGIQVMGTGFSLSKIINDVQPQPLFLNFLKAMWKDLQKETEMAVILLDDVQNFALVSGIFTILKNVLSDEEIVKNTKFLFILSSTPEAWNQFLKLHHPIGRYFTPRLELEKLDESNSIKAINLVLKDTGVSFDRFVQNKVYEYTSGHPYEMQILCSNLYDNQVNGKVIQGIWEISLNQTVLELGKNVFEAFYNLASLRERQIFYTLALIKKPLSWKELTEEVANIFKDFPKDSVGKLLSRLLSKGLIQQLEGKYFIQDKLLQEYIVIKGLTKLTFF